MMARKKNAITVVLVRNDQPVAFEWRFFASGSEFYAAVERGSVLGKASFHSGGRWQWRYGTGLVRLDPNLALRGGWLHAMSVHFLVLEDSLRPPSFDISNMVPVEIAPGEKIVVDMCLTRGTSVRANAVPPTQINGMLGRFLLRSGRQVVVTYQRHQLSESDRRVADRHIGMTRINLKNASAVGHTYSEVHPLFSGDPGVGNAVLAIPLRQGNFHVSSEAPELR